MQLRREGELAHLQAGFRLERVARAAHAARADPTLSRDAAARPRVDRGAAALVARSHRARDDAPLTPRRERAALLHARRQRPHAARSGRRRRPKSRASSQEFGALAASRRATVVVDAGPTAADRVESRCASAHRAQSARQRGEVRADRADGARQRSRRGRRRSHDRRRGRGAGRGRERSRTDLASVHARQHDAGERRQRHRTHDRARSRRRARRHGARRAQRVGRRALRRRRCAIDDCHASSSSKTTPISPPGSSTT